VMSPELDGPSEKLFQRKLNGMRVARIVLIGKFESGYANPFGIKYRMTVEKIEKVEESAISNGQSPDPSWVPKNCNSSGR
jgi:hypothetical protein